MTLASASIKRLWRGRSANELLSGSVTAFALKLIGLGAGYLLAVLVSRQLGADAWGAFSLSLAIMMIASVLSRLGLDSAGMRAIARASDEERGALGQVVLRRVSSVVLPLSLVSCAVLFVSADLIAVQVFNKPQLAKHLAVAAFGVPPLSMMYVCSQAQRGLKRVKEYVFFDLVARFVATIALLPLILSAVPDDVAVTISFVIATWLVAAANALSVWRVLSNEGSRHVSVAKVSQDGSMSALLSVGRPLFLASSILFVKAWIDTLMLGVFVTEAEVGIYQIALRSAALVSLPLVAVNAIAAPRFARDHAIGTESALQRSASQTATLVTVVSIPVGLVLLVSARMWLGMFGPEATAALDEFRILVAANLVSASAGSVGYLLQMTGQERVYRNISLGVVLFSILCNLLLIPRFGILGAAVSTAVGMIVWNVVSVGMVRARVGVWSVPSFRTVLREG